MGYRGEGNRIMRNLTGKETSKLEVGEEGGEEGRDGARKKM